jgi:hypothetical protein
MLMPWKRLLLLVLSGIGIPSILESSRIGTEEDEQGSGIGTEEDEQGSGIIVKGSLAGEI